VLFAGFDSAASQRHISIVGRDGSGPRKIAGPGGQLLTPILHPDGTHIAYIAFTRSRVSSVPASKKPAANPAPVRDGD
jgi:hypothetical protein